MKKLKGWKHLYEDSKGVVHIKCQYIKKSNLSDKIGDLIKKTILSSLITNIMRKQPQITIKLLKELKIAKAKFLKESHKYSYGQIRNIDSLFNLLDREQGVSRRAGIIKNIIWNINKP